MQWVSGSDATETCEVRRKEARARAGANEDDDDEATRRLANEKAKKKKGELIYKHVGNEASRHSPHDDAYRTCGAKQHGRFFVFAILVNFDDVSRASAHEIAEDGRARSGFPVTCSAAPHIF